jgi:hypothetical protein
MCGSGKGEKISKRIQKLGSQKYKVQMQMRTEYESWCTKLED